MQVNFYGNGPSDLFHNLLKDSIDLADNHNTPTISQLSEYKQEVIKFIKKRKRIIYGGTAIHYALQLASDGKDGLYDGIGKIDYDFYTPDPIGDSIDLCNILFEKKFPYVKRNLAISGSTYRIQVNTNIEIADLSYCPQWLFDKLPTLTSLDGVLFIHPSMLRLDMYKAMGHIPHDLYRFKKDYTRLQKLEEYYPMRSLRIGNDYDYELPHKSNKLINSVINDYILQNQKEILITGDFAYNFYVGTIPKNLNKVGGSGTNDYSGKLEKTKIKLLAIIVTNFDTHADAIYAMLQNLVSSENLEITKRASLIKIVGRTATITYKNHPIILIQDARTQVVPYLKIAYEETETVKITDYFGTLAFYHIMKIIDEKADDEYTGKIVDLKISANKYTQKHNLSIVDKKNPFRLVSIDGMETHAKTSEPSFKFSGKGMVVYMPELAKITPDAKKNLEYYENVVDKEIGGL